MHIHILGICGTFMGGLALIARQLGHQVSGSDIHVYPPMSTQLAKAGIEIMHGYKPEHLQPTPDQIIVGNAVSRGNPAVEYMLRQGLNFSSGPQWLSTQVLPQKWVLAVAGTHGKTTTSSMLAWILEYAGLQPGFLIGGVPNNFGLSAQLGKGSFFVVEADEYDTAFFDKRSKFVHYRPRTLITNNLEFDHADIFEDLAAIQRQFHHLIRTVPDNGLIISPSENKNLHTVFNQGCWTPIEHTSLTNPLINWHITAAKADGSHFDVVCGGKTVGRVSWSLTGQHNIANALTALAAARHAGVPPNYAIEALCHFKSVKRRMELRGEVNHIKVYDDFAHHPTAIASTLQGLRAQVGKANRILAVLEPRSNTMKRGTHANQLADALQYADHTFLYMPPELTWQPKQLSNNLKDRLSISKDTDQILTKIVEIARPGDTILIMSNGSFADIHTRLLQALQRSLT